MKLPVLLASVAAATLLLAPARASTRPWTIDDILSLRTVTDPQISPDGRWVAYVVAELNDDKSDYQTDVWLVSSDGGTPRRLTTASANDEHPRWAPDGSVIAFLSERPRPGVKPDADRASTTPDDAKRQLWMIHPDGGEAWIASESPGGAYDFAWSDDGRTVAYLAHEPKTEERKKREKEKDDAWTPSDHYVWNRLWVLDVASRKATQLTRGDLHVTSFSFSPDGRRLVFAGQPTPLIPDQFQSDLYLVSTAGGAPTPLVRQPGEDGDPAWSPDGKWIAFISQDAKNLEWYSNNYVCVVPAAGGATRNLSKDLDERAQGLGGGEPLWMPDSRSIVFQSSRRTAQLLHRASLDGKVDVVANGREIYSSASVDVAGDRLVYLREDGEHPREVWRMKLSDGDAKAITDTNPQVRELPAFKKELVSWQSADGRSIEGLLIRPLGDRPGQKAPMILNVHGGPAGTNSNTFSGASRTYGWPLFAQKGYAILFPNPRGSGGYGEQFRSDNVRDWGGRDYEDLMAGVDAMGRLGVADPARLAVCGWSYGGYMTSTIVTKTDRFRAAVVGAGVTDLISMAGTCDIPEFNRSYFGSWPWEDPQVYIDHSAVLHAGNVKTPTLMVHGGADERVPTSQGWEFYTALKKVGVPTDLLVLPRQPHGPREPKLLRSVLQWHQDWINRYTLGSEPQTLRKPKAQPMSGKSAATAAR